jgi:hypothetical protein
MKQIAIFSLETPAPAQADELPRAELIKLDRSTGIVVQGSRLEAQYEVSGRFLLMLTEDCPYEEGLHIYLLDGGNSILDETHMGQPYTPGILSHLEATDHDELQFAFFGNDRWKLEILQKPRRMPFKSHSPQVETRWSRLFSKHFLELTRMKP